MVLFFMFNQLKDLMRQERQNKIFFKTVKFLQNFSNCIEKIIIEKENMTIHLTNNTIGSTDIFPKNIA